MDGENTQTVFECGALVGLSLCPIMALMGFPIGLHCWEGPS